MPKSKQDLIKKLIKISKEIIKDSSVENGAIVAANTDKIYYPRQGANYRWVWPRDAAFICLAAYFLKMRSIYEKFFNWLLERPQDFKREGLLFANYATNGRFGSLGKIFEPDQGGTILWVIYQIYSQNSRLPLTIKELIKRLADGLCSHWQKKNFSLHTVDLWEEVFRQTTLTMENNHTYSLAACARGLLCANQLIPTPHWKETALEMIKEIDEAYQANTGYFYRNVGKVKDPNIDASLIGLAWPFEIYNLKDKRIIQTIKKIEEHLVIDNGGVCRYQFDYYDSEGVAGEGGGAWPILNFWLAIYWCLAGQKNKALKYYYWPLERIEKYNYYLPEQIFSDFRVSVYPLVWSHAMFIIASKYLGFLK